MPGNGYITLEGLERDRVLALSAQSERDDVAIIEIVYRGRWCKFDISAMQASFLTLEQLVDRCFRQPFEVVQLPLAPSQGQLSASTLVLKE